MSRINSTSNNIISDDTAEVNTPVAESPVTPAEHTPVLNAVIPQLVANATLTPGTAVLLRKLVSGSDEPACDVMQKVAEPWRGIAEQMIASPDIAARSRILVAGLSKHANSRELTTTIMQAPIDVPLNNFPEFKERFKVCNIAEAFAPQPPAEYTVDNLILRGSLVIVFGAAGGGKTWAMLDLALCIATGESFGSFGVRPAGVLIVDEESGPRRLKDRLARVARGHGIEAEATTPLHFVSLSLLNLASDKEAEELKKLIMRTQSGFVLIDALADVMAGKDENSVQETQPILMRLRQVAEDTTATIVVIHHENKSGKCRGSSAIMGGVDLMLSVEKVGKGDTIRLVTRKERDIERCQFEMDMVFQGDSFRLSTSSNPSTLEEAPIRMSDSKRHVLEFLGEHGASLMSMIIATPSICGVGAARRAVYTLAKEELVQRVDKGGQGVEATFELTEAGASLYELIRGRDG